MEICLLFSGRRIVFMVSYDLNRIKGEICMQVLGFSPFFGRFSGFDGVAKLRNLSRFWFERQEFGIRDGFAIAGLIVGFLVRLTVGMRPLRFFGGRG
jgi:hypothetical protein